MASVKLKARVDGSIGDKLVRHDEWLVLLQDEAIRVKPDYTQYVESRLNSGNQEEVSQMESMISNRARLLADIRTLLKYSSLPFVRSEKQTEFITLAKSAMKITIKPDKSERRPCLFSVASNTITATATELFLIRFTRLKTESFELEESQWFTVSKEYVTMTRCWNVLGRFTDMLRRIQEEKDAHRSASGLNTQNDLVLFDAINHASAYLYQFIQHHNKQAKLHTCELIPELRSK